MKGKKAEVSAEYILLMAGVIIIIIGAIILISGFSNNNSNTVSIGAVIFLVGTAILALAKKIF